MPASPIIKASNTPTANVSNGVHAANGANVLQRCVSLATGALSPDERVNYVFGMVLGVDDFRQEQLYHLIKDYRHNRSLHGYGTVFGLQVGIEPIEGSDDRFVTVSPGMGIDQFGRTIIIRDRQCARIGAWYARQIQDGTAPAANPGDVRRAYVVVRYSECEDALVPIAGQPCSTGDTNQAASRLLDAFTLELLWAPPLMAAWDAVRAFADLLASVEFVPGLPPEGSDEDQIVQLVRDLVFPPVMEQCDEAFIASPPLGSPPTGALRLPAEGARQALDRIFTVWVTDVRPVISQQVNLIDADPDENKAGILLACVDFLPGDPFDPAAPAIDQADASGIGRPILLHTQLIQELLMLGGGRTVGGKEIREFATLQVRDSHTLRAWIHHPVPVDFVGDPLAVLLLNGNGGQLSLASATPVTGFDNLYELATADGADQRLLPGMRLALAFQLSGLTERNGASMLSALADAPYDYEGHSQDVIEVYATVDAILPSQDLATVTADFEPETEHIALTLWFHTDQPVHLPETIAVERTLDGAQGDFTTTNLTPAPVPGSFGYRWRLQPPSDFSLSMGDGLALTFDATTITVGSTQVTLGDLIIERQLSVLGFDGNHAVRVFYQVDVPQQVTQQPPGLTIEEILLAVAQRLPATPFVTVTFIPQLVVELWFHLDRSSEDTKVAILEIPKLRIFAEVTNGNQNEPPAIKEIPITSIKPVQPNVFQVGMAENVFFKLRSSYIRFEFPLEATKVNVGGDTMSLFEYIKASGVKFDGHDGDVRITAFARVPQGVFG